MERFLDERFPEIPRSGSFTRSWSASSPTCQSPSPARFVGKETSASTKVLCLDSRQESGVGRPHEPKVWSRQQSSGARYVPSSRSALRIREHLEIDSGSRAILRVCFVTGSAAIRRSRNGGVRILSSGLTREQLRDRQQSAIGAATANLSRFGASCHTLAVYADSLGSENLTKSEHFACGRSRYAQHALPPGEAGHFDAGHATTRSEKFEQWPARFF